MTAQNPERVRDIVVRGVAEGHDPDDVTLGDMLRVSAAGPNT